MSNVIHSEHVYLGVIDLASEIRESPEFYPYCAEVYDHLYKRLTTPQNDAGDLIESVVVCPDAIAMLIGASKKDVDRAVSMLCSMNLLAWVRPKPKTGLGSVQLPKK